MEEGEVPSFKESLDNSLVELAESPTLQLLLYPVVPPPLREWIVGRGEVISRRRLEEFLAYLNEQMEALRRQGITKEQFEEFFDSEEWFDLFRQALAEALRTRSRDRREYCARILKGAIADHDQKKYSPEEYLNLIANFSDLDLRVAGSLYRLQEDKTHRGLDTDERWEAWKPIRDRISREQDIDNNDLSLVLERLVSSGLVERILILVPGSPLSTYWVSTAFDKLMEFLCLKDSH